MFTRSSSSVSLGNSSDAKETGSGGLLHGLRKKTLLKMTRSSSASSASLSLSPVAPCRSPSPLSPHLEQQAVFDARTRYFLVLMKRFQEQDCSLRQLEAELGDMLMQIQSACSAITRAVEVFTQTFRYDAASYKLGVDYLAMMKQIACDGVEVMEQSIRFTVVDPIVTRLERHAQLKGSIHAWERLHREVTDLQCSLEQHSSSGKDERRRRAERQQLSEMQEQLAALQDVVTPLIEETTETYPAASQVQLFNAMRLQLALFFYNTNQSLFGRLSETEAEIVRGSSAQQSSMPADDERLAPLERLRPSEPVRETAQSTRGASESAPSRETTVDKTRLVSPLLYTSANKNQGVPIDDDEDDLRASTSSSITLEEFELGKSPPDAVSRLNTEIARSRRSLSYSEDAAQHMGDIVNLLALASNPLVPDFAHDSAPYDHATEQPDAEKSDDDDRSVSETVLDTDRHVAAAGVFSSLKRSVRGKFRVGTTDALLHRGSDASPTGSFRTSRLSNATLILPSPPSLSEPEWRQIERCLWEMDRTGAPSPPKRMLPPASASSHAPSAPCSACKDGASVLHHLLDINQELFFECTSFLPLDAIGRLAKVDRRLRSTLRSGASVWKQCIRSGGLAPAVRGAVWLDMLYGKTLWESSTTAPHHLSARETREKIYEQLLMKVGTRMANSSLQPNSCSRDSDPPSSSASEETQQLLEWLHEIDVDVARTCNKDIYAKDVADDWNTAFSLEQVAAHDSGDDHALIEALVESALLESLTEVETDSTTPTPSQSPQSTLPKAPASLPRPEADSSSSARGVVEAKIRRVLRAYAMYNPRVGYCQGMNFLVRVLLEVSDNEADVFWLFVGLSEPEINRNLYEPGLAMLQPLLAKFELLVSYHMPELYVHFQREGVHVAAFSTRWFMTLFSSFETFGPSMVLRVLDLFVIDGWRVLLSMGLVVLDELRSVLVGADLEDILRILQFPRNYLVEPDHARRRQLVRHALAFCVTRAINTL